MYVEPQSIGGIFGIFSKAGAYKLVKNMRIETLDLKINQLHARKKRIEAKRTTQFAKILNRCHAHEMPEEILAGAILEAVRAYKQNDSRVSTWKSEGLKVLKPGRGRRRSV